jgi:hypothetical protein
MAEASSLPARSCAAWLLSPDQRKGRSVARHASAVSAVLGEDLAAGLLVRCLENRRMKTAIHREPVTTGKKRGPRLDRWIEADDGIRHVLYQVEIKSWCAHSYNGKSLVADAGPDTLAAHRLNRWQNVWDSELSTFKSEFCRKVFVRMQPPARLAALAVEPLLCFWDPLHPEGRGDPFFTVDVKNEAFCTVNIFSASNYLRSLGVPVIELSMPQALARLRWLCALACSTDL